MICVGAGCVAAHVAMRALTAEGCQGKQGAVSGCSPCTIKSEHVSVMYGCERRGSRPPGLAALSRTVSYGLTVLLWGLPSSFVLTRLQGRVQSGLTASLWGPKNIAISYGVSCSDLQGNLLAHWTLKICRKAHSDRRMQGFSML